MLTVSWDITALNIYLMLQSFANPSLNDPSSVASRLLDTITYWEPYAFPVVTAIVIWIGDILVVSAQSILLFWLYLPLGAKPGLCV